MEKISRRLFIATTLAAGASAVAGQESNYETREWQPRTYDDSLIPAFSFEVISLEVGGQLGVSVLDTETGRASGWDENSLFPLNSTFKFLLAGAVLWRAGRGQEQLDRQIAVQSSDIVSWSPVVRNAVGDTMDVRSLCEAAMTRSDNAAANLLLHSVGVPRALTEILRDMGDPVTRIDRYEPALNDVPPGDPRDSSTPSQMLKSMERLMFGDILSAQNKELLSSWMIGNTTGGARIRAGVPSGWMVGDRTGTGPRGETATIAAIYPPNRKPLLMVVYIKGSPQDIDAQASTHAELARIATTNLVLPPYDPYANE